MYWYVSFTQSPEKQKAQESYTKFNNLHRRLSTEQVLYQHRLGSDLVSLANRPVKLIFKLYEHESIQQRGLHGSMLDHLPGKKSSNCCSPIVRSDRLIPLVVLL